VGGTGGAHLHRHPYILKYLQDIYAWIKFTKCSDLGFFLLEAMEVRIRGTCGAYLHRHPYIHTIYA
jgi:hypothetical protein